MIRGTDPSSASLAADSQGVGNLRQLAKNDPKAALRETARQFEALLLNSILKSMRETVGQDGMFDNEQTRLYTSMLDQQLAQSMSQRGIGLADVMVRQLAPTVPGQAAAEPNAAAASAAPVAPGLQRTPPASAATEPGSAKSQARDFVERLLPEAEAVSRETGIPARFLMGHAALESGWGRKEIRAADGSSSHNLFGIKAGAGWTGRTVDTLTTEYVNGVAQKKVETFRAYDSYQDAFRDYANLLQSRPRYAEVLKNTHDAQAYARELQQAGYATDPRYADKLASVIDGQRLRISMTA